MKPNPDFVPSEGGCRARRHDPRDVQVRGTQRPGAQPTSRSWVPECLQHHRWHGGRCG